MSQQDFQRLHGAYSAAWAVRSSSPSADDLLRMLQQHGLTGFGEEGPAQDLIVGLWRRGVPPERLRRDMIKAFPRLALQATTALAKVGLELWGLMRGGEWVTIDRTWMDLPPGHIKLTDARHEFDLVRRWFYPRVHRTSLEITLVDGAAIILGKCYDLPSPNREGWFEADVWLRLTDVAPTAEVMVGTTSVGATRVPTDSWHSLSREAAHRVHADGRLFLPPLHENLDKCDLEIFLPD